MSFIDDDFEIQDVRFDAELCSRCRKPVYGTDKGVCLECQKLASRVYLPRLKPPVNDSGIEFLGYNPHPVEDEESGFMGPQEQAEQYTFWLIKLWGGIVAVALFLLWLMG